MAKQQARESAHEDELAKANRERDKEVASLNATLRRYRGEITKLKTQLEDMSSQEFAAAESNLAEVPPVEVKRRRRGVPSYSDENAPKSTRDEDENDYDDNDDVYLVRRSPSVMSAS